MSFKSSIAPLCTACMLAVGSQQSAAQDRHCKQSKPDLPILCSLHLPKVVQIKPEAPTSTLPEHCAAFSLHESEVRQYFNKAKKIAEQQRHARPFDECTQEGTVEFASTHGQPELPAKSAHWRIDAKRGGMLDFGDGTRWHLYCTNCKGKPYFAE